MEKSKDPLHNQFHVFRILDDLNAFLKENKEIDINKINYEVLLLSICWHDTWKSKRFPGSIGLLFYQLIKDGTGSMALFKRYAKKTTLDKEILKETKYAIKKHGEFQILPRKTLESKILKDLDLLEKWSLERLKPLEKKYLVPEKINLKLLRLAKFYFDHFLFPMKKSKFYFKWSQIEFKKRKTFFLTRAKKLLKEYQNFL
ncbi:hypothetical protein C4559_03760 [Candidatus Microgenomates bacterium]|nr:MAG: hypothetical protein C4559_03760 [Candidatus Microgenomates bacterium]